MAYVTVPIQSDLYMRARQAAELSGVATHNYVQQVLEEAVKATEAEYPSLMDTITICRESGYDWPETRQAVKRQHKIDVLEVQLLRMAPHLAGDDRHEKE